MDLAILHGRLLDAAIDAPMAYDDFFARTWQCSHVRLCRCFWDANDFSLEDATAWALYRNRTEYRSRWVESIPTAVCRPVPIGEIASTLNETIKEIANSDHLAHPPKLPLAQSDLIAASDAMALKNFRLYDLGPLAIYIWRRDCEYNFFELHYES